MDVLIDDLLGERPLLILMNIFVLIKSVLVILIHVLNGVNGVPQNVRLLVV